MTERLAYEVWYTKDGEDRFFSSHLEPEKADADAARMTERIGIQYHVKPVDITNAFQPPPSEQPRDRFSQRWDQVPSKPGYCDVTNVDIVDKHNIPHINGVVARYNRGYPGTPPFEPFRQKCRLHAAAGEAMWRHFALIAPDYMGTSVIALDDGPMWCAGDVVASEDHDADCESRLNEKGKRCNCGFGFCPIGFYVPDWHDAHDGSIIPGTYYWKDRDEWPDGTLGFVWGCYWGDDNGWKVQALDLSDVQDGVIKRDDRFGYLYLDTHERDPRRFIRVGSGYGSGPLVMFSVPVTFNALTGRLTSDMRGESSSPGS